MGAIDPRIRRRDFRGRVSLSSICFASDLGGMSLEIEQEDGTVVPFTVPGLRRFTLAEFPALVAERTAVRSVEVCQVQTAADGSELDGFEDVLGRTGTSVLALALDLGNLSSPDPDRRADSLRKIQTWIDVAERLGVPFLRVSPGARPGAANHDSRGERDSLRRLSDRAGAAGVCLLVENYGDPEETIALIERVGADRLGLILDTGNIEPMISANMARFRGELLDEAAMDFDPVYAAVERLAPYATIVHAKIHDMDADGRFQPLDVPRLLRSIAVTGFDGPVTVECEGRAAGEDRWAVIRRSIATVEDIFAAPAAPSR